MTVRRALSRPRWPAWETYCEPRTATGRRRLAEMEAAGLVEVTERPEGWLSVRPITDSDEAADVAQAYASQGRAAPKPLAYCGTHPCH